jgi:uncharacterized protein (DUF1919 family)
MGDGQAVNHYNKQRTLLAKEKMVSVLSTTKSLFSRIRGYFLRRINNIKISKAKKAISTDGFTIISQNCIGGVLYHDLGMQFLSPTINAFIPQPDFVRFVLNLRNYMECELDMRWGETYPIGRLKDIEIHFMHYHTCQEAEDQWNRRKQRIKWDKIMVLSTDRDGFDDSTFAEWKKIPYSKVLFTANEKYGTDADSVFFKEHSNSNTIPDLIPNRDFYRTGLVSSKINNL